LKSQSKQQKISSMRNLGPAVEKDLNAVGIFTPEQVAKLGAKKTFLKMLEGRLNSGRGAKCCNAAYLYAIFGAINDIDWREIPEIKKDEFKAFTQKLRESQVFEAAD